MKTALTLTADLMFRSKLDLMLRDVGLVNVPLSKADSCVEHIEKNEVAIVILDLCHRTIDALAILKELRGEVAHYSGPILCYSSHVKAELMKQAEENGATRVIPNSKMSARGHKIIAELIVAPEG